MLWRSLAGLPETYREPMVLFYRQGQSIAEVAQSLDLSEDAVKQRLSRGRAVLRDELTTVVETTLTRSRPTRAFTATVLAVLPTVGPSATEAALATATATAQTAGAAKGLFALVGKWTFLGPVAGLLIGLASSRAAASTGRSPQERACLRRHALQIVIFCWVMSIGLAAALVPAGKLYTPSSLGVIFGVLTWVAVLVGVILWRCQRMDKEVLRIRAATRTDDASYADILHERGSLWPRMPFESKARFLSLPLLAISSMGTDASKGPKLRALGWIAVGDTAISPLVAFGGVAIAPLAMGGITIGLASFSLWGIGVGALAFGSIAIGWWAFGLGALGWQAAAGGAAVAREYAVGALASAAETNTAVAKEWFLSQWFVSPVGWFLNSAHWIILAIIGVAFVRLFYKSKKLRRFVPHTS